MAKLTPGNLLRVVRERGILSWLEIDEEGVVCKRDQQVLPGEFLLFTESVTRGRLDVGPYCRCLTSHGLRYFSSESVKKFTERL